MTDQPDKYAEVAALIVRMTDHGLPDNLLKTVAETMRDLLTECDAVNADRDALLADKKRLDDFDKCDTHVSFHDGKGWAAQCQSKWLEDYYPTVRDALDAAIDAAMQAQSEQWTLPPQKQMPEDIAEIINKGLDDGSLYD